MHSRRPAVDGSELRRENQLRLVVEIPLFTWVLYIQQYVFVVHSGFPHGFVSSKTALLNPPAGLDAETLGGHAEGASEGGRQRMVGLVDFFGGVKGLFGRGF